MATKCKHCYGKGKVAESGFGYNKVIWVNCSSCQGSGYFTDADVEASKCFIATATYGSSLAPEVLVFRHFRDSILLTSKSGNLFVKFYYITSPPLANLIEKFPILKKPVHIFLLNPILKFLKNRKKVSKLK